MTMNFKVGRASVAIDAGWLIDPQTSVHKYESLEFDPVYETTTTTTHYSREYRDYDGDIQKQRWSTVDESTDQVGSTPYRVSGETRSTTYRVNYDNGHVTAPYKAGAKAGLGDRVHRVGIVHPLLRGPYSETHYSMADNAFYGNLWTRIVTYRARREVQRRVDADRLKLLSAISKENDWDPMAMGIRTIVDGRWNASKRRVESSKGTYRLPSAGSMADGDTVGLLLRTRHFGLPLMKTKISTVVDAWVHPTGRHWSSRGTPIVESLWEIRAAIALAIVALGISVAAIHYEIGLLALVAGFFGLSAFLHLKDGRGGSIDGSRTVQAIEIEHGMRHLRRRFWIRAMYRARRA